MRQKVGFARAMAVEPELLCLDEPFSSLDILSAETLRGELMELWTSGKIPTKAILMVTHNIDEAALVADRILIMDKDPGRIVSEIKVGLTHPRQRKSPAYLNVVDRVYSILAGQTQPEAVEHGTAPGQPGRTRALPHISANELAGLLEHLAELPGRRADIFRLSQEFKFDSDYILRIIEAAELLGFATVAQGDITLNTLGETFAEASILARKEIFASRIRRLPLFTWLMALLRVADNKRLQLHVVETALELEFPAEEAGRQVETAINWGRYSELISYDDNSEILYLEPGAAERVPA
jgi:NitT/TauT family transport system ATP-binding protein